MYYRSVQKCAVLDRVQSTILAAVRKHQALKTSYGKNSVTRVATIITLKSFLLL